MNNMQCYSAEIKVNGQIIYSGDFVIYIYPNTENPRDYIPNAVCVEEINKALDQYALIYHVLQNYPIRSSILSTVINYSKLLENQDISNTIQPRNNPNQVLCSYEVKLLLK
jgi:hypothetical protein